MIINVCLPLQAFPTKPGQSCPHEICNVTRKFKKGATTMLRGILYRGGALLP